VKEIRKHLIDGEGEDQMAATTDVVVGIQRQIRKGSVNPTALPGSTNTQLTPLSFSLADFGVYDVLVTNVHGSPPSPSPSIQIPS
tara:strand:+ start:223 stop:477 length:255 start_codon:yes stop_codon:yes gene_type:complete